MFTVAGFQVPVIGVILVELVGNTGAVAPLQIESTILNVGVAFGFTVTVTVTVSAHWPDEGVNV